MCIICDGGSRHDMLSSIRRRFDRYGLAIQGVDVEPPGLSWSYTVGLAERFGHAELVVLGGSIEERGHVLNALAAEIESGASLEPGIDVEICCGSVAVGDVHPRHVENGLVATWFEYYDHYSSTLSPAPALQVLQVVLPDGRGCHRHQTAVPLLADPLASWEAGVSSPPSRVDRAERRRRERAAEKRRAIELRHLN
jgi:hypothetical protein